MAESHQVLPQYEHFINVYKVVIVILTEHYNANEHCGVLDPIFQAVIGLKMHPECSPEGFSKPLLCKMMFLSN